MYECDNTETLFMAITNEFGSIFKFDLEIVFRMCDSVLKLFDKMFVGF